MNKATLAKNYNLVLVISFVLSFIFFSHGIIFCADIKEDLNTAQRFHQSGDYQAEIVALAGALKEDPANPEIIRMLNDAQRLLDTRNKQIQTEKIGRIVDNLNKEAGANYDKGELRKAIRLWAKVLIVSPEDDNAVWMIQKAQRRMKFETESAGRANEGERVYSRKIQNIADEISKLMDDAKEKIEQEKEQRRKEELDAIKEDSKVEESNRLLALQRVQRKEENFIMDAYRKGQEFYQESRYDEAVREWESILPLLTKDNKLRGVIEPLMDTARQKKTESDARQFAMEEALRRAGAANLD